MACYVYPHTRLTVTRERSNISIVVTFPLQDNIQQFLLACRDLGLKDAQLFDIMDLQEPKGAKTR